MMPRHLDEAGRRTRTPGSAISAILPAYPLILLLAVCLPSHASHASFSNRRVIPFVEAADSIAPVIFASLPDTAATRPSGDELAWHSWLSNIPSDWARFGRVTFRTSQAPVYLAIAGMTGLLMATDKESYRISDHFYKSSGAADYWSSFCANMGDGRSQFGLAGAFALYGLVAGESRPLRTGSQILEAVLASGTVVQVLKHVTGRESPFVATSPTGTWRFFPNQIEYHKKVPHYDAFPSGHICTSIATVTVIAENYPEIWWIKPLGYTLTALIGVGMVNEGIHWYSDYPLGLMLGYTFGMIATHPEENPFSSSHATNDSSFLLYPSVGIQGMTMNIAFSF